MLTYSVIVGERTEQIRAIPVRLIFHFDSIDEANCLQSVIRGPSPDERFGGKKPTRGYYVLRRSISSLTYANGVDCMYELPTTITTAKYAKGKSRVVIADDRFEEAIAAFGQIVRNESYSMGSGTRFSSSADTYTDGEGILSVAVSYPRINDICGNTHRIITDSKRADELLREVDSSFVHIEVPKYDKELVQNMISILSLCYGETVRKNFVTGIDKTIESLERMVYSKSGQRYALRAASAAPGEIVSGRYSESYKRIVDYRERYIRCR